MGGAEACWGSPEGGTGPRRCRAGMGTARALPQGISVKDLPPQGRIWPRFPKQHPPSRTVLTESEAPRKREGMIPAGPPWSDCWALPCASQQGVAQRNAL